MIISCFYFSETDVTGKGKELVYTMNHSTNSDGKKTNIIHTLTGKFNSFKIIKEMHHRLNNISYCSSESKMI